MLRLVLVAALVSSCYAANFQSTTAVGDQCDPDSPRRCPPPSVCEGTVCRCPEGTEGIPGIGCGNPNTHIFTGMDNDPNIHTWGLVENSEIPIPCQMLFTRIKTDLAGGNKRCDLSIETGLYRGRGKIYLLGYILTAKTNTNVPRHIQIKVQGMNNNGSVIVNVQYRLPDHNSQGMRNWRNNMNPNTYTQYRNNIVETFDQSYHTYKLAIDSCGFEITYRPANPWAGLDQQFVPGMFVAAKRSSNIQYLNIHESLSLSPGHYFSQAGAERSSEDELIYRALQTIPNISPFHESAMSDECSNLYGALSSCITPGDDDATNTAVNQALEHCRFIVNRPKFFNCYNNLGDYASHKTTPALQVLGLCIQSSCTSSETVCEQTLNALGQAEESCGQHIPTNILDGSCESS